MSIEVTSTALRNGHPIPQKYTADGQNLSPPLSWGEPPAGTRSLALIVDDPDAPDPAAPRRTWVHWVVHDIPASATELPEDAGARGLPSGARVGKNDWSKARYGGPCPPIGRHRYFFKLYALDQMLSDQHDPKKAALEKAMQGHVLAQAELVGSYQTHTRADLRPLRAAGYEGSFRPPESGVPDYLAHLDGEAVRAPERAPSRSAAPGP